MTVDTCKAQIEKWKRLENAEMVKFWTDRMNRKIMRHEKYAHLREVQKSDGKKPKG